MGADIPPGDKIRCSCGRVRYLQLGVRFCDHCDEACAGVGCTTCSTASRLGGATA